MSRTAVRWPVIGVLLAALSCAPGCDSFTQEITHPAADEAFVNCDGVKEWEKGDYEGGDKVQALMQMKSTAPVPDDQKVMHLFSCTNTATSAFCGTADFEPGNSNFWDDTIGGNPAWEDLGQCSDENKLTIVFPQNVSEPATRQSSSHQANGRAITEEFKGRLQCGQVEHAINGKFGESFSVKDIAKGTCALIMEPGKQAWPMNTPAVFDFPKDKGSALTINLAYRRSHDPAKLLPFPGIKVELFAAGLDQPRAMALNDAGDVLFVGSSAIRYWVSEKRQAKGIYALQLDPDTKLPIKTYLLDEGLEEPHGVAYRDGSLYYSTVGALYRIKNVDSIYKNGLVQREKIWTYPADDVRFPLISSADGEVDGVREQHQKHPIYFSPNVNDKFLYTAIGRPCNVCTILQDNRYGTIIKIDLDTGKHLVLADGIRNTVGFDWHPDDKRIWFGDNNRQASKVSNVVNSDELNVIKKPGTQQDYGAPYIFGSTVPGYTSEEYLAGQKNTSEMMIPRGGIVSDVDAGEVSTRNRTAPAHLFQSNSAPLGLKFWPKLRTADGDQRALVALHGPGTSDRRAQNLMMVTVRDTKVIAAVPAVTGWLMKEGEGDPMCLASDICMGRPTDMLVMPDGSMLLSDDVAGQIYRLSYTPPDATGTQFSIKMPESPDSTVVNDVINVILTGPEGIARDLNIAWGTELNLNGLKAGEYNIYFSNSSDGEWVPDGARSQKLTLVDGEEQSLEPKYKARPTNLNVEMILKAPERPKKALAETWDIVITDDKGNVATVNVPWEGQVSHPLNYGTFTIKYPFTEGAYPKPALEKVEIEDQIDSFEKSSVYTDVDNLGQYMLEAGDCTACHQKTLWDSDGINPYDWREHNELSLKIMSMQVATHCDTICAGEISKYLIDNVWKDKLEGGPESGPRQMRLLAKQEFINSVYDILGVRVDPQYLPGDQAVNEKFHYGAEAAAGFLAKDRLQQFYGASVKAVNEIEFGELQEKYGSSAEDFAKNLGRMLFRRSLSAAEVSRYVNVYQSAEDGGAKGAVLAMLSSPNFLYRSELGVKSESGEDAGFYILTGPERATALSFNLLGTTPDLALIELAEKGGLDDADEVKAKAKEMLDDERAGTQMALFISYYMGVSPDTTLSVKEGLSIELIRAMRAEVDETVKEVFRGNDATMDTQASLYRIFNPGFTYLTEDLAAHYEINATVPRDKPTKVTLSEDDAKRWGGPLNTGLFAIAYSGTDRTSIITRGFRIRQHLYCQSFIGNAERGSDGVVPDDIAVSEREFWDIFTGPKAAKGTCWNCHKFFNDTGASMENYNPVGKFVTVKKAVNEGHLNEDVPIVTSGPFVGIKKDEMWISNMSSVRDIAKNVPTNKRSLRCMAEGYYRFTMGARFDGYTDPLIERLTEGLLANDTKLKPMMIELMTSQAMLRRRGIDETRKLK